MQQTSWCRCCEKSRQSGFQKHVAPRPWFSTLSEATWHQSWQYCYTYPDRFQRIFLVYWWFVSNQDHTSLFSNTDHCMQNRAYFPSTSSNALLLWRSVPAADPTTNDVHMALQEIQEEVSLSGAEKCAAKKSSKQHRREEVSLSGADKDTC